VPDATIDYAPLTSPVSRAEITAFRRRVREERRGWGSPTVGAVFGAVVVALLLAFFVVVLARNISHGAGGPAVFSWVVLIPLGLALWAVVRTLRGGGWNALYRVDSFAHVNGFDFEPRREEPGYPGMIFGRGSSRHTRMSIRAEAGRALEIANYYYTTGSGKSRQTHDWGFLAMRLDRTLPHMVLDAKSNNSFLGTNLPSALARDQALSLEGDFDDHFTLYCPRQYERDALYVFTPDLMALLIDNARAYDVEIVDDWMLVYSPTPFDMTDATLLRRLFRIVDTVGSKTLRQTTRYADERVGDRSSNVVAPQGRRLRTGVPVLGVVVIVVFAMLWLLPRILDAVSH
jgi:hypothetical protein